MRLARARDTFGWTRESAAMLITLREIFFNVASRMNCANHMAPESISKSSYNLADARCIIHAENCIKRYCLVGEGRGEEKD
jgi:hypothetical protein